MKNETRIRCEAPNRRTSVCTLYRLKIEPINVGKVAGVRCHLGRRRTGGEYYEYFIQVRPTAVPLLSFRDAFSR